MPSSPVRSFISLNRIDAGTFAVIQQSKIFFTALFQWMFFGRTLSQARMCALFTLVLGVLLISLEAGPSHSLPCPTLAAPGETLPAAAEDEGLGGYVLGIVAVTLDCLLSGLATVYFEKVLKTTSLTVWDRNLQLAFYSMLIYIPWSIYSNPANPLAGWSINTVVVALLGALGGILVALVIKYADGLAKNISTASSIVLTTAASHYLFDGAMNHAIIIGSMVVVASGYNYQNVP
jgi:UDP-sugar transporter A1/2/3